MLTLISTLFITLSLVLTSFFLGNGSTPLFSYFARTRGENTKPMCFGYGAFFVIHIIYDIATHVFAFTWTNYIIFAVCIVFSYFCHKMPKWSLALSNNILYYILSNTVCFIQMSGLIPEFTTYPCTIGGYFTCMAAGLPFAWKGILVTVAIEVAILAINYKKEEPIKNLLLA